VDVVKAADIDEKTRKARLLKLEDTLKEFGGREAYQVHALLTHLQHLAAPSPR
jgi:predicted metalloprotease